MKYLFLILLNSLDPLRPIHSFPFYNDRVFKDINKDGSLLTGGK